jgi:hypothetical protein
MIDGGKKPSKKQQQNCRFRVSQEESSGHNLVPDELHTLSFFENDEKRYRLNVVADELKQRYGQNAVYFGGIHSVRFRTNANLVHIVIAET